MWHKAAIASLFTVLYGWLLSLPAQEISAPYVIPQLRLQEELSAHLNWAPALERARSEHRLNVMRHSIARVIEHEGGYANTRHDPGGPTRYGITVSTARKFGYSGRMDQLPAGLAAQFYERIWVISGAPRFDNDELAFQVFDAYVQHGPRAVRWRDEAATNFSTRSACLRLNARREAAYRASKGWVNFGSGWMKRLEINRANCGAMV